MAETIGSAVLELSTKDKGLVRGINEAEKAVGRFHARSVSMISKVTAAVTSLGGAFSALAAGLAVKEIVETADALTLVDSRLSLVTDSAQDLTSVQTALYNIANQTRVSFQETANLYARIARSSDQLGVSQADLLEVTEAINKALIVSGASAVEANAALIQFSQGLASGALRGEELASVLEQTPRLAQAIADGLGKTIGELRDLGAEGALTAERVIQALLSQTDEIDREFTQMRVTVGQALTVLNNELGRMINTADEGATATESLARFILRIADALRSITASGLLQDVIDGFAALWDILSYAPKEAIEYISEVNKRLGDVETQIADVKAAALDRTTWDQFVEFLTGWGNSIIDITSFVLKSAYNGFMLLVGDVLLGIKSMGQAAVSLGGLLWDALTLDIEGVRRNWDELKNIWTEHARAAQTNFDAAFARIREDFDRLVLEMSGVELVAPVIKETPSAATGGTAAGTAPMPSLATRERNAATSEMERQALAIQELLDQLRFEIDVLKVSEAEQRAMTLARSVGVEVGSEQYEQILNLVRAHMQERDALESKTELMERGRQLTESLRTEEELRADKLAELNMLLRSGAIDQETYNRALRQMETDTRELDDTMTRLGATFTSAFEDAVVGAESFSDALQGLLEDITRIILRMQILGPLAGSISSFVGGLFGGGGTAGASTSAPKVVAAAGGGTIPPGATALVGELGPEIIRTGSQAATVIPNSRIGGDVVVNIVNAGQPLEVESQQVRTGPSGEQVIDVAVRASLERMAGSGRLDKILAPYSVRRQVAY